MQYSAVLAITAQSAWSTLCILDRQGRKDTRKVLGKCENFYHLLTSPQAVQTYRSLWQLLQIACMVAIALGMSARALVDQFIAAQQLPTVEPIEVESPLEPEPAILALPAPKLRAEHSIVPFRRRAVAPAVPTDAELVKWAKQNRSLLSGLKVGKWSYSRKLRQAERQAVLAAMRTAKQSA